MSRQAITSAIADMPVVNHHEHAWRSFSAHQGQEYDLPFFLAESYLGGDIEAAGFRPQPGLFDYLNDPQLPDGSQRAWKAIAPYLQKVRNTSYFRYLTRSLADLFSVNESELFSSGWRAASQRIRHYSQEHKGRGSDLCSRMRVTATVLDANLGPAQLPPTGDSDHQVVQIARMDMFIHEDRGLAEILDAYPARDFEQWLDTFDTVFVQSLEAGAKGYKSGLAYNRRIQYGDPPRVQVARIFKNGLLAASPAEKTAYQDFMVNRLCSLCAEAGVPLQIHAGIHAGIGNTLENARPTLLNDLFRRHPDLRFDLFHGGYPWVVQSGLMAKYFPNVYIDGCWLAHISPTAYRAALTSWIETVPMNKIFAWGGDHNLLELSYASLALARDLITEVLTDLVQRGYLDLDLALEVARRILHDNGTEFWNLTDPKGDAA